MILVTGATGKVGGEVARLLLADGAPVRALARSAERAAPLAALGAEVAVGDLGRPGTLGPACAGVDALVLVPPDEEHMDVLQRNAVEAAAVAGVERIVKLSLVEPDLGSRSRIVRWHASGERDVEASGLRFTHVRANSFLQNLLWLAPAIRERGAFESCMGDRRMAWVDTRDVASTIVAVLARDDLDGQAVDATGPEALAYGEIAARIDRVVGTPCRYVDLAPAVLEARLRGEGWPAWLAEEVALVYGDAAYDPRVADVTDVVERLTGRPPRSLDDFLRDHAADFRAT
ncbi:MAG: NAD(P)H-binding protein [Thermoleophilia bacterium]